MKLITLPNSRSLTTSIRATALVFEDPRSKALLERIEMVAPSEANVLIIGDTGTGKELIARQVHSLSNRAKGAFVPVNCGALTDSLVESELFGHEKGAFTGAVSQRAGWFEAANGGTIFLDEIGDLPLSVQVKLLRVLQEREVYRLGSRTPVPIDVRVIAATNVRLDEAVAAGHFREDLLYRLRVVGLDLHPLRDRPGDILPIASYFVADYCHRLGYENPVEITPGTARALLAHPWPGNIRELENVIHHALLICKNNRIEPENLHLAPSAAPLPGSTVAASGNAVESLETALIGLFEQAPPNLFEEIENIVFRTAYRYCQENQLQTARLLDISRNVVRARLLRSGDLLPPREQVTGKGLERATPRLADTTLQPGGNFTGFPAIPSWSKAFQHRPIPAARFEARFAMPPVDSANASVLMHDWPG